jgi:hypothetical protein
VSKAIILFDMGKLLRSHKWQTYFTYYKAFLIRVTRVSLRGLAYSLSYRTKAEERKSHPFTEF